MIELGEQLKKARKARSISLESIADVTKIREDYLRKIEAGDWEFLPEPYVRAFVKLYANEVGLNGEQLLRKYDIQQVEKKHSLSQLPEDETVSENPPIEEQDIEQFSSNKVLNYFEKHRIESYFIIASLLIVIILAFVYYQKGNEIFDATVEQRIPEISIDSLLIAESDSGTSQIPSELHLELLIRAIEETWISISIDDSASAEYTFQPGHRRTWQAKSHFTLSIGNPRGIELYLDDEPLKLQASGRRKLDVVIGPDGIQTK